MTNPTYSKPNLTTLKENLSDIEFKVTQLNATEHPFDNRYWNYFDTGLYVDVTTNEPLFSSFNKFESSCGWPSFTKPITPESVKYVEDKTLFIKRVEVRSQIGDSHLGHVFEDGPKTEGGLRFCINSASLKFIPYEQMNELGYSELKALVKPI